MLRSFSLVAMTLILAFSAPTFLTAQAPDFDCTVRVGNELACSYSVFPQIAVGGGFSGEVFVVNQGYQGNEPIRIEFFGDDGSPLVLDTDQGSVSQLMVDLPAGESRRVPIALDSVQAVAGYVRLTYSGGASVRGTLLLRVVDAGGGLQTQLGVGAQIPLNSFTFRGEVDSARGVNTGLALANGDFELVANPDPSAQGFVVSLIEANGTVSRSAILNLGLNEHLSLFLDDDRLFPGLDGFDGTVTVSAGIDFGLLALRLESGLLSTTSIDSGPVLSAFDISGQLTAIDEVEPNGNSDEAQALEAPSLIRGNIGVLAESDVFSVGASAGDILTAFVISDRNDSVLDSFLSLERAGGALRAINDLNGLNRRFDSFLRVAIPEDGDYFLRVEDFFRRGGPDFGYQLVVLIEQANPSP